MARYRMLRLAGEKGLKRPGNGLFRGKPVQGLGAANAKLRPVALDREVPEVHEEKESDERRCGEDRCSGEEARVHRLEPEIDEGFEGIGETLGERREEEQSEQRVRRERVSPCERRPVEARNIQHGALRD